MLLRHNVLRSITSLNLNKALLLLSSSSSLSFFSTSLHQFSFDYLRVLINPLLLIGYPLLALKHLQKTINFPLPPPSPTMSEFRKYRLVTKLLESFDMNDSPQDFVNQLSSISSNSEPVDVFHVIM